MLSGAVIRYRAYATKGLTGQEIGVLVAICWFTFVLAMHAGRRRAVLLSRPEIIDRFFLCCRIDGLAIADRHRRAGSSSALYVFGSWLHLKPLKIGGLQLHYPALPIVCAAVAVGPIEILAAAAIIYFALPEAGNPGYIVVLGVFLVSFSIA